MDTNECSLCKIKVGVIWLPLYVMGTEGIFACLSCRVVLTNIAAGLRSTATRMELRVRKQLKTKEQQRSDE